ncbi:MAG: glycine cleavage system aminomethyltransferase GcvT [bacterium]|nr:glycine cleavage system aminomethyltransferase GcvT [bacterium]MDD5353941.1 glycine cleavage system aminomethyltransferase GcvT [bacterium]MDD5756026.1 glycine cleavage system aminomethyltransferase GcvT [bacterium]
MKQTKLYHWHQQHKARLIEFGGWLMPVQYSSIIDEYWAVRKKAGLFDICHMGEITVIGDQAEKFLQQVMTNDVSVMAPGDCLYSLMCYDHGGIVDDLFINKISRHNYLLVVNAANTEKDYQYLMEQKSFYDVMLNDISESTSLISLQGPGARDIMVKLAGPEIAVLDYLHFAKGQVAGKPVTISRTGYTGELGYEIFYFAQPEPEPDTEKIWQSIIDQGAIPCGLGARDILRLEMKYSLYGNDIDQDTNPLKAGLDWAVKLEKDNFIGKTSLEQIKKAGLSRKLAGLTMQGRQIARHGFHIFNQDGKIVGQVTSGTFSPTLAKSICLGYIRLAEAALDNKLNIEIRGEKYPATIVKTPFVPSHVRD